MDGRLNCFTLEEKEKFFAVIDNKKDQVLFKLMFETGIRPTEVTKIRPHYIIKKGLFVEYRNDIRIVPLSKELEEELINITENTDYLFNINNDELIKVFKDYCYKANINNKKIYSIRSTFVYNITKSRDYCLEELSKNLGHRKTETTCKFIDGIYKTH